ncbi:MAG: aromatic ring-hydroxylating dioxygenase subunit alpha, partial [Calditrichia bacterium]
MKNIPQITASNLRIQPLARASTIPSEWYTRPEFHEWDKACIFSRTWQAVGHLSRLKNTGDYLVANIADNPIIVVCGKDEKIRAFYNVCRHRGGPLAFSDGQAKALQCKYHGWTYRLDGTLRGTPQFDGVENFDKKDYCLLPLPCEIYEGLVFVRLTEEGEPLSLVL